MINLLIMAFDVSEFAFVKMAPDSTTSISWDYIAPVEMEN